MIYLKNNTKKQEVWIPRQDQEGAYVSPCEKCYQEGFEDGAASCGNIEEVEVVLTASTQTVVPSEGFVGMSEVFIDARNYGKNKYDEGYDEGFDEGLASCNELEEKDVVVTAATQTVLPSSGYDGMSEVYIDATEYGNGKYGEGYDYGHEVGFDEGQEAQKSKLTSTAFTQNGTFTRADGWDEVTVNVADIPAVLQEKTLELGYDDNSPWIVTPDNGYEGLSKVTITDNDANGYGKKWFDMGWDEAHLLMVQTAITQNGVYSTPEGYSEVTVNVPQTGSSCNLQDKSVTLTAKTQTVLPSSGYDGMSAVTVDATDICGDSYDEGVADQKAKLTTTAITQNGVYSREDGFSEVTVNVPTGTPCSLQDKSVVMTAQTETFYPDGSGYTEAWIYIDSSSFDRSLPITKVRFHMNNVPSGTPRLGATEGCFSELPNKNTDGTYGGNVDQESYGYPRYHKFNMVFNGGKYVNDFNHTNTTEYNITSLNQVETGVYELDFGGTVYWSGVEGALSTPIYSVGTLIEVCVNNFHADYDGMSAITVDASGIYNEGYNEGYKDGIEDYNTNTSGYLTYEAKENLTLLYTNAAAVVNPMPIYYRKNGGSWTALNTNSSINLNKGDVVEVKSTHDSMYGYYLTPDNSCYVYGNVMSLIYGDDFKYKTEFKSGTTAVFKWWFSHGYIESHPAYDIVLPVTTLVDECYYGMFQESRLSRAPEIPATTVAWRCCDSMFQSCMRLEKAPSILPATTLAEECYDSMFMDCIHFNGVPPVLPATTLAEGCYCNMFYDCEELENAPALPATTLAEDCYNNMFGDCVSLETAPVLPAQTLVKECYDAMFMMSGVKTVECYATDISAQNCTKDWLTGVPQSGTFIKPASMNDWTSGSSGIPTGWSVTNI